jgi:23S rRNA (cytidine2498-2'-O)-methyltransferase
MRAGAPTFVTPKRAAIPQTPAQVAAPEPKKWLYTCRAGFEPQLFEELAWAHAAPKLLGAGWVEAAKADPAPAFARMAFEVLGVFTEAASVLPLFDGASPLHLQAWPADTDAGNRLTQRAEALKDALEPELTARGLWLPDAWTAQRDRRMLFQLCPLDATHFVVGRVLSADALSLSPGGRHRMARGDAPSRAAMKLEEALANLTLAPGKGELCVDLGAAPGGWTQRLVQRGARVLAVDPGALTPELQKHPKVKHHLTSAFTFEPPEPADWLFCDMAWRPLEVAQLLAKWARRGWASMLVANLKLPMKDKLPMIAQCKAVLADGGWQNLRVRQLYHDRDEVTVTAQMLPSRR